MVLRHLRAGLPFVLAVIFSIISPHEEATAQSRTGLQVRGDTTGDECGAAMANILDVDGDGIDDIAIGCPDASPGGLSGGGLVKVISGSDGSHLYDVFPTDIGQQLGSALISLGQDIDADTWPDFAAGAPTADGTGPQSGHVILVSGHSGSIISTIDGPFPGMRFGSSFAGPLSLNPSFDSVPDILVGAPNFDPGGGDRTGLVYGLSGTTYDPTAPLFDSVGHAGFDTYGTAIAILNDRNLDGIPEFAVGSPGFDGLAGVGTGAVTIVDGSNGVQLSQYEGLFPGDNMGVTIAYMGDLNGDSFHDFAVGSPSASRTSASSEGIVVFVSGMDDATELYGMSGENNFHDFGIALANVGDQNGDGVDDLLVGDSEADFSATLSDPGSFYLLSGTDASVLWRFDGRNDEGDLGRCILHLGNTDGDFYEEFLVSEPGDDQGVVHLRWHNRPSMRLFGSGQIGTDIEVEIISNAALTLWLLWDFVPGPIPTPCGQFDIGFSPLWSFIPGLTTDVFGQFSLTAPIPNDASLVGLTFYAQAIVAVPYAPNGKWMISLGDSILFQ